MPSKKLRVAIVGLGYWGSKIARVLNLNSNFELVAVSDLNKNSALAKLKSQGVTNVAFVSNYQELMLHKLDLVVIAVPPQAHISICNFFLSNKINVFVEKPFGLSQIERQGSVNLAHKNSVRIFVDHTYLFSNEFIKVKQILHSGEIGPINFYTSSRVNLGLLQESTNVVEDLMIHDLAILDVLFEESPIQVTCVGSLTQPSRQIGTAFANLIYANDRIANVSVSWHSPVKIRQINIVGQSGAITWNDTEGSDKIKIYSSTIENSLTPDESRFSYHIGDGKIPRIGTTEPLVTEFEEIYKCLTSKQNTGFEFLSDESHILRTGKTLEALVQSLQRNEPVNVD